jgi:hypothetical protein
MRLPTLGRPIKPYFYRVHTHPISSLMDTLFKLNIGYVMINVEKILGVALFVGVFTVDLFLKIDETWYILLFWLMSYLFGIQPSKAIAKVVTACLTSKRE